jgi:hypothetical protein
VDLILKLQEIVPLPSLKRDRQISIKEAPTGRYTKILMYQHWVWKKLLTAIEKKDFVTAREQFPVTSVSDPHTIHGTAAILQQALGLVAFVFLEEHSF